MTWLHNKVTVFRKETSLAISYAWFGWTAIAEGALVIMWIWGLLVWTSPFPEHNRETLVLFYVSYVAAGILLFYHALTRWLNRTEITVDRERIKVRVGPVPWPGSRDVCVADLIHLWSNQIDHDGHITYEILALVKGRRSVSLASGFETLGEAEFARRQIEGALEPDSERCNTGTTD